MRVLGYIRVSTDKQAESGLSLEAQDSKIREYCKLYDHELVHVYVDEGASAKTLERPQLKQMLSQLHMWEADAVIVTKLDRMTRSVRDLDQLISEYFGPDGDYDLVSIGEQIDTSNAAGRMVLNILMSVSQWEREAIGERTSAAMQAKKARGERVGAIPYGWTEVRGETILRRDMKEQRVINHIRQSLRMADEMDGTRPSLRVLAQDLNDLGYTNRSGRPFHPQTISNIINQIEAEDE